MNARGIVLVGLGVLFATAFAACGGGSVGPPQPVVTPVPTATPTPVAIPTSSPFVSSQTQVVTIATAPPSGQPTPPPVPVQLSTSNGFSTTLSMPVAQSAGTENIFSTMQNVAPTAIPALDLHRAALALRKPKSFGNAVALLYYDLYWSSPITFLSTPGFAVSVPPIEIIPFVSYYLALYDPTRPSLGWQYGFEGPATISGSTLTFAGSSSPFSFAPNLNYWFAVIAIAQSFPGPTPAPSIAPTSVPTQSPPPAISPAANMTLTFDDEFNGSAGTGPDPTKWTDDTGPWSDNHELEYYANVTNPSAPNYTTKYAAQDGSGNLVVSAYAENLANATCWYGPCQYTSARLTTRGVFTQTYGYIEARIKIPVGTGLWPAFWLSAGNQQDSGEIDVMENVGSSPSTLYGALHGPGFTSGPISVTYVLPHSQRLADDYHLYGVLWAPNSVQYFLDNELYATVTPAALPSGATWVFNTPFYLVLNLAVGGSFPGSPNGATTFPAQMLVDYVHVYQ